MNLWVKFTLIFVVKSSRVEVDSSGVYSKKSCSSLRHLGLVNLQRDYGDLLG
jgi:hypothetical protein